MSNITRIVTIVLVFTSIVFLFPVIYWAMENVEDPTQSNMYSYLFAILYFIISCIVSGAIIHLSRNSKWFNLLSILFVAESILLLVYSVSVFREFYPFTNYQVGIFQVFMILLAPALIFSFYHVSRTTPEMKRIDLFISIFVSGVTLLLLFALAAIWWASIFVVLSLLFMTLSIITTTTKAFQYMNKSMETGKFMSKSKIAVVICTTTLLLSNAPVVFATFFQDIAPSWAGRMIVLGLGFSIAPVFLVKKLGFFLPLILGAICTVTNLFISVFMADARYSMIPYFVAGLSYGFLLPALLLGFITTNDGKVPVKAINFIIFAFFIGGIIAALDPLLGDMRMNVDARIAISWSVKIACLVATLVCTSLFVIIHRVRPDCFTTSDRVVLPDGQMERVDQ